MHVYRLPKDEELVKVLQRSRTIAVVGLSDKSDRPSFSVAQYLQKVGYRIIPVNPKLDALFEEKAYPSVHDIPGQIDVVNVFRRSEFVPEITAAAIDKGAKTLWLQEGIIHYQAAQQALAAGLTVVMDRCILKEHQRLLGE
ncbi:MAG: CoA-binding protein [bacterium]